MVARNSIFRVFSVLLIVLFMPSHAQPSHTRAATISNTSEMPVGLNADDWENIQTLLPVSTGITAGIQSQHAYLKASNSEANDNFGSVVSLSGDTLVLGAPNEDGNTTGVNGDQADNSVVDSGAVYVFVRNGEVWSQQAYLKASNTSSNDHFGSAVSISGETLVVGASGVDAAYVFIRTGTTWSQQAYLQPSNLAYFRDDRFGEALSLSGDTLVVGASGEDSTATGVNGDQLSSSASESGAAYVFTRTAGVWSQQAYLKASNTEINDYFGSTVSIAGDTIAVGAFGEDGSASGINGDQADNSKIDSGAVYVFTRAGIEWSQQAYLKASNPDENDRFGRALSLSGETLVVGAPYESSFSSVVNGNQNDNSAFTSGAVYVFSRTANMWDQQEYIKPPNTGMGDQFGAAVSLSGDMLVVGAPLEDSSSTGVNGSQMDIAIGVFPANESGAAYIFARTGTTWEQQTYLKASNTGINDQFGSSVSNAGDLSAIGAPLEDSAAAGVNGDQLDNAADASGAAYVFGLSAAVVAPPRTDYNWSHMVADAPNQSRSMDFKLDLAGEPHMVLGGNHLYYATIHAGTWELETVDPAPAVGRRSVSLVFDSNNHPHVAYQGSSVQYAYWNGSAWIVQSIPNSAGDADVSIAMDSSDRPKIVFSDLSPSRGLRYANWTGTKWVVQQIDTCASSVPSLVIDSSNIPHISYDCGGLRHATWADNSWHVDSINTPIDASGETSIAVDTHGWPHIAYNPPFPTAGIGYVSWNGTAWDAPETVDATGAQGVSLLIDDLDVAHISYSGNGHVLNEATSNGSTWDIQTVPNAANICSRTSLALDDNGNRHIGYIACLPENFYHTYETSPGTWSTPQVIVESSIFGSPSTSMAIDQNDHPHLSTEDWYQGTLRYSSWDGAQWLNQIVDHVGVKNTHVYSSIKTDSNNRPHIAYFGTGGLLKYASWDGSQWQIQSFGLQGGYASLALDKTTDHPRIAFCSDGLKYASWDGSVWNIQTVDPVCGEPDYGGENSLILDDQGNPHIAYVNGYVYWDDENSLWVKDASALIGGVTSLALDSTGTPHISACGSSIPNHRAPEFASWDGSTWNSTTIDDPFPSQNAVCLTTSLAIDDNDIPYISYVEPFGDTLRLVTRHGTVWSSQIVETNATGLYTPIVAGPNHDLWIAYLDSLTGNLMVTHGIPVPPTVSAINRVGNNPTAAPTIEFAVKFSESVSGLDGDDFVIETSGITDAAVVDLNGSDNNYTVTVSTGIGNGTIRLDVVDNNSIVDADNNPLGGPDIGDGNFTLGEEFSIVRTALKPGVPVLLSPATGVLVTTLKPILDWKDSSPAAHHYQLQVSTNSTFTAIFKDETNIPTSTFTLASDLLPGKPYYWRVKAFNVLGVASAWSSVWNFKTPLAQPTLVSPVNDVSLPIDRPDFEWNDVSGATSYILQISASNTFGSLLLNVTTNTSEYKAIKDLTQNKPLYWRVAARTTAVVGAWSSTGSFKTGNPTTVPVLGAPVNNSLVKDYTPLFNWSNAILPAGTSFKYYELQVDDNSDFSSIVIDTTTASGDITDSDFTPGSDLASNTKFYWRVRAVNVVNSVDHFSAWSTVWSFRTVLAAPGSLLVIPNAINPLQPTFDWANATGPGTVTNYTIQVSTSPTFGTFLVNSTTTDSIYVMLKNLPVGKTIYWRVKVNGSNGPSAWTTGSSFMP